MLLLKCSDLPGLLGNALLLGAAAVVCVIGFVGVVRAVDGGDGWLVVCWAVLGAVGAVLVWCGLRGCVECLRQPQC